VTIDDFLPKLGNLTEDERVQYLPAVLLMLSPLAQGIIVEHQKQWGIQFNKDHPLTVIPTREQFQEFCKQQEELLKDCILLELDYVTGTKLREQYGLKPLTQEAEIKKIPKVSKLV